MFSRRPLVIRNFAQSMWLNREFSVFDGSPSSLRLLGIGFPMTKTQNNSPQLCRIIGAAEGFEFHQVLKYGNTHDSNIRLCEGDIETLTDHRSVMRLGTNLEQCVRFSPIIHDNWRHNNMLVLDVDLSGLRINVGGSTLLYTVYERQAV